MAGSGGVRSASAASNAQIQHLNAQVNELQATCQGLEKERDFYFASECAARPSEARARRWLSESRERQRAAGGGESEL